MSWLKANLDSATGVEYSTLFHSGLRAISLRKPRAPRSRTYSSSSSSQESSSSGRTSSVTPLPPSLLSRSTHPPSPTMSISTESSSASQPRTPKVVCRHQTSMLVGPTKEAPHAWASEESFFDMGENLTFPEEESCYRVAPIEIDWVRSLAGSRSFFMNKGEVEGVAVAPRGEESFLLLSSSPDMFLHHPDPRCECPMSMQMSLPPCRVRETRRDRGDCAWMLEESSPEPKVYEFGFEGAIQLDGEPGDMADWRQFHVDLLATIC